MRVLGIDPGTSRWAFVFLEDGKVEETIIPTRDITPEKALELAKDAELIVAPSGYGAELKKVSELTEKDFKEILLKREGEKSIMGLEGVLRKFKAKKLNAYVIPGVKLLPTVMEGLKLNKIDMGTPDKLCVAVAGIVDQARRLGINYNETSFVVAEIGFAFDAFIAVNGGQIVDGIGGTLASSKWKEDGEILYLQGKLKKEDLKRGVLDLAKVQEGALKDIQQVSAYFEPKEILVSGSRSAYISDFLSSNFKDVRMLKTCKSNAAYGAAVLANGLAGGEFKAIIDLLRLKDAKGSNLDHTKLKWPL